VVRFWRAIRLAFSIAIIFNPPSICASLLGLCSGRGVWTYTALYRYALLMLSFQRGSAPTLFFLANAYDPEPMEVGSHCLALLSPGLPGIRAFPSSSSCLCGTLPFREIQVQRKKARCALGFFPPLRNFWLTMVHLSSSAFLP